MKKTQWRHVPAKSGNEQLFKDFKVSNLKTALTNINTIAPLLVSFDPEVDVLVMASKRHFTISIEINGETSLDKCLSYANKIDSALPEYS